jgi:hypothetical protein
VFEIFFGGVLAGIVFAFIVIGVQYHIGLLRGEALWRDMQVVSEKINLNSMEIEKIKKQLYLEGY